MQHAKHKYFKEGIALLKKGYSRQFVSKKLHVPYNTVKSWTLRYKIDDVKLFRKRIKKEGIPNRLNIDDNFGFWLAGFTDGEGCFHLLKQRWSPIFNLSQSIKNDKIIYYIKKKLKVGSVVQWNEKTHKNRQNQCRFTVSRIQDIVEVIIPLFEKYKLKTEKQKTFNFWKKVAKKLYLMKCGGQSSTFAYKKQYDKTKNWYYNSRNTMRYLNHVGKWVPRRKIRDLAR